MKNNYILSGRYELLHSLGKGMTSSVYLARHISLERTCAVKIIPKESCTSLNTISEAQILRSLHHPGIPQIYDIEEDEQYFYLIEEYASGESLDHFLLHQKTISHSLFFTYCEQLCDIFDYLHTCNSAPILYQDLKPEHVIVDGTALKLIDFGDSCSISQQTGNIKRFGNLDFSAPESISERSITTAADIYSIGKLMEYLSGYLDTPIPYEVSNVIQQATQPDPTLRFETVQALHLALTKANQKDIPSHLLQKIAIVGSSGGCGCTHLAVSLVTALNTMGISSFYYEKNDSLCINKWAKHYGYLKEQSYGFYRYRQFVGFPKYGPGIRIPFPDQSISVYDFGACFSLSDLESVDLILLICPEAPWKRDDVIVKTKFLEPYTNRLKLICNPGERSACRYYSKHFHVPVYPYYYDPFPLRIDHNKEAFVKQLLNLTKKGRSFPFFHAKENNSRHLSESQSVASSTMSEQPHLQSR